MTTYYPERNKSRLEELRQAIQKNLENPSIDEIVILNEGGDLSGLTSPKLEIQVISSRPTYQHFFEYINNYTQPDDINIIANTDIYFDVSIAVLKYTNLTDKCFALARWNIDENRKLHLFNRHDSQDTWIFKGKIKSHINGDFPLGVPRCDNRILYELDKAGYKVINPAFSVKSYHLHAGDRPDYTKENLGHFVPEPYKYLYPKNIYNLPQTLFFNLSHSHKLTPYKYDIKKINQWIPIRFTRKLLKLLLKYELPLIGYK